MRENPKLEELVEFPSAFTFQVVADSRGDLDASVRLLVEQHLGREVIQVVLNPSSGGKYLAVRVTVTVLSADEIRGVYAALRGISGLRFLL